MGHTNSTANLSLPQFIGTDKPTWLGDINGAFSSIDSYAGTNNAAVAAAASDASSAISQAATAVSTANTANTTAGNASTAANNAVGVANNAVAIAGVVDGKVGLLADLHTTDRTSIVNAINEVNGKDAGDIAYDNSGSGLTATNVQDAIDEIAQGGGGGGTGSVEVTADGTKTNAQLMTELFALVDFTSMTRLSTLSIVSVSDHIVMQVSNIKPGTLIDYGRIANGVDYSARVHTTTSMYKNAAWGSAATDDSATVPTVGTKFIINY